MEDIAHLILDCSREGAVRIKLFKLQYPAKEIKKKSLENYCLMKIVMKRRIYMKCDLMYFN